jgi:hypothetical protein
MCVCVCARARVCVCVCVCAASVKDSEGHVAGAGYKLPSVKGSEQHTKMSPVSGWVCLMHPESKFAICHLGRSNT